MNDNNEKKVNDFDELDDQNEINNNSQSENEFNNTENNSIWNGDEDQSFSYESNDDINNPIEDIKNINEINSNNLSINNNQAINQNEDNHFEDSSNNSSEFSISITDANGKQFNGPFELFYSLIKERKMDILNINLVEVIQLYVDYINRNLLKLKIDDLTEYLLMATYLLEQKSKRILPSMDSEETISKDIERDKYIQRLLVYKQYQEIVPKLMEKMERRSRMFERQTEDSENKEKILKEFQQEDYVPTMDLDVILKAMQKIYLKLVTTKKTKSPKDNIKLIDVSEISIDDVEKEIREFLEPFPHLYRISFLDYFKNIPDEKFTKRYFVVAFVAILVLVRNGHIQLEQNNSDEQIFIVKIDKEVENSEY